MALLTMSEQSQRLFGLLSAMPKVMADKMYKRKVERMSNHIYSLLSAEMMLAAIFLLVIAGISARADAEEPPYGPSGWKPSGAAFLLPVRNEASSQINEPFPPLAPPPSFSQFEATNQFIPTFQAPTSISSDRLSVFRAPASPQTVPATTRSQSPSIDHRPAPENRVRTNSANQDNQPFVYKSKSVVRPLQGLSQYDDQARPSSQNQSPFPKQYLPPLEGADGNASFTDLSPPDPDDNIANYSTSFPGAADLSRYRASLTDSESPRVDNQLLFRVNNAGVSNRPAQEYGEPSLLQSAPQNSPRIFFVILPVRQPAGSENTQTQALASTGGLSDRATPQRFPERLL